MLNDNIFENQMLLGLILLLGGTQNLKTAIIIGFSSILIAFVIKIIYLIINSKITDMSGWLLLLTTGFSLSYFLYLVLPGMFPFIENYINIYLLLTGLTPLVYSGCRPENSWYKFIKIKVVFLSILFLTAVIRELLGQGTIFDYSVISDFSLGIIKGPVGSFIILGGIGLIYYIVINIFDVSAKMGWQKEGEAVE